MSNKFLRHDEPAESPSNAHQPVADGAAKEDDQPPADLDRDIESEDINAIAETQPRKFPILILLVTCAAVIALLAGVVYYAKNEIRSIGDRQKPPATSPDPLLSTKPIQIHEAPTDTTATEPAPAPLQDQVTGATTTYKVPAAGSSSPQADPACPHVPVKDPLGGTVMQANGMPAMVDCRGRVVRAPEIQPKATPGSTLPGASGRSEQSPQSTTTSRYRGAIVIGPEDAQGKGASAATSGPTQAGPGPTASADAALATLQQQFMPFSSTAPGIPPKAPTDAAPPGAANGPSRSATRDRAMAIRSINEDLVIPKGHTADCTLTMRAVTETNGFAECIIAANVYSANGRTLLIERFSKALGEYNVASAAGQRVIPILWTSIRKPGGITIELSAPAVDGLGGAGVPATVDNRWGERIGGAYLLSIVKDVIAYKTAKDAGGSAAGQVYQNTTQASNDLIEKILNTTIAIRPTLYANQGDRAMILFNRDVDFSGVYDVQRHSK